MTCSLPQAAAEPRPQIHFWQVQLRSKSLSALVNAPPSVRERHLLVYGDSCSREFTNSLLATLLEQGGVMLRTHVGMPNPSAPRCYTRPRCGAGEDIPQCGGEGQLEPRHAASKGSRQYDAAACGWQSDGPGIDLPGCGSPTGYSVLLRLGRPPNATQLWRVSFQFKTYLWTPFDAAVLEALKAKPPDLLVVGAGSSWGVAPFRKAAGHSSARELLLFSHRLLTARAVLPTVWLMPRPHIPYDGAADFEALMAASNVTLWPWPAVPRARADARCKSAWLHAYCTPYAGHCFAGTVQDIRAAGFASSILLRAPLAHSSV